MRALIQRFGLRLVLMLCAIDAHAHDIDPIELHARQISPQHHAGELIDVPQVLGVYGLLGVEHILTGLDHLMFVISLVLLLGFRRRLAAAITGFTLGHSLTLALGALKLLSLPAAPVEAWIALSIVLVSAEALSPRESMTRRQPLAVPATIGLVHGLGFASALEEVGLPEAHLATALLSFNLGVEAGQLGVIGIAWMMDRWTRGRSWSPHARTATLWGIGAIGAYWTIERIWAITAVARV